MFCNNDHSSGLKNFDIIGKYFHPGQHYNEQLFT